MQKIEVQKTLAGTTYTFCLEIGTDKLHIDDIKVGNASIKEVFDSHQLQLAYNDFYQQYVMHAA